MPVPSSPVSDGGHGALAAVQSSADRGVVARANGVRRRQEELAVGAGAQLEDAMHVIPALGSAQDGGWAVRRLGIRILEDSKRSYKRERARQMRCCSAPGSTRKLSPNHTYASVQGSELDILQGHHFYASCPRLQIDVLGRRHLQLAGGGLESVIKSG